jgi:xylulose-5-phosphate/fructose-6-phosphate phosphoketolase
MANALSDKERTLIDAYWRAANYLSVGQIYLYDNPLLKQPLSKEHIKPRLLGHWGTTPGLNFLYVHLNRVIRKYDLDMSASVELPPTDAACCPHLQPLISGMSSP